MEQTYDADLEVVSWPSEEGLLLRGGGLLGRHCFLFLCGECAGDVEGPAAIERCESRGGEGRAGSGTERASSEDEQPSESISLHRIFTPGAAPGKTRKPRRVLARSSNSTPFSAGCAFPRPRHGRHAFISCAAAVLICAKRRMRRQGSLHTATRVLLSTSSLYSTRNEAIRARRRRPRSLRRLRSRPDHHHNRRVSACLPPPSPQERSLLIYYVHLFSRLGQTVVEVITIDPIEGLPTTETLSVLPLRLLHTLFLTRSAILAKRSRLRPLRPPPPPPTKAR